MKSTLAVIPALLLAASAQATLLPIPNGSFENTVTNITSPLLGGVKTAVSGGWDIQVNGLLNLGASVNIGNNFVGGPVASQGTNHVKITVPVGLLASANVTRTLTNTFLPYTVYRLKLALDQGTVLGLLNTTSLKLKAGTNTVATLAGTALATVLDANLGYQPVELSFVTGQVPPTGNIGLEIAVTGGATVGGTLYVDDVALETSPVETRMKPTKTTGNSMTVNGSGGPPMGTYYVLACTNVFGSANEWVSIATNHFDALGNYQFTVPTGPETSCYFRLQMP